MSLTKNEEKVAQWFFDNPNTGINLNSLLNHLPMSKTTLTNSVNSLVEKSFLKKEILGKTYRLTCNKDHKYNETYKRVYNLKNIYESEIVSKIVGKYPNYSSITLFGSYATSTNEEKSDLDIAIEIKGKQTSIKEFENIKLGHNKEVKVNLTIF